MKRAAIWLCGLLVLAGLPLNAPLHAQAPVAPSTPSGSGLISQLTKQLSVTPTQARGGAGTLFALAKTRLSADEFSKVSSAVPSMSSLLKAAPVASESSPLSSLEGALPGNMGRMAETADAFHKLGLSPEMAGKFLPVMTKYVESRGGSSTASLLEKALK
jgi:hypothetical protein